MHRRTYQHNYGVAAILGIVSAIGFVALLPSNTYATLTIYLPGCETSSSNVCNYNDATATNDEGVNALRPTTTSTAYGSVIVPVGIKAEDVSDVHIKVTSSATSDGTHDGAILTGSDQSEHIIPTLSATATISENDFRNSSSYNNRWAMRQYITPVGSDNVSTVMSAIKGGNITPLNDTTTINDGITWSTVKASLAQTSFHSVPWFNDHNYIGSNTNSDITIGEDNITDDDKYNGILALEFAAKFDNTTPPDTYSNEILVSVVAEPKEVIDIFRKHPEPTVHSRIFGITYMQDMTTEICQKASKPKAEIKGDDKRATNTNRDLIATYNKKNGTWKVDYDESYDETKRTNTDYVQETILFDKRDNKPYLVRRLADGNCWMASNLDYTISTDKVESELKNSQLTDYNGTWNNMTVYDTQTTLTTAWGTDNNDTDGLCSFSWDGYAPAGGTAAGSKAFSFKNTSDFTFSGVASGTLYEYRGTLYNWNAATLTTSATATSADSIAGSSTCPGGWKLPGVVDGDKSWTNLFNASNYNIPNNADGSKVLAAFPLDYPRTGNAYGSRINGENLYGVWWTDTALNATYSYYLDTSATSANSIYNVRSDGFAIRCVAR